MPVDPAWADYYRDEMDSAWLYRALANSERDPARHTIFERLVAVEDAHVEQWRGLFQAQGRDMFLVGFGVAAAGYLIGDLLIAP